MQYTYQSFAIVTMIEQRSLLLARTNDLIRCADKKGMVFTHFLSESELAVVMPLISGSGFNHSVFGGYDDAQRCIIGISSCDTPLNEWFPLRTLRFKLDSRLNIVHRDVLGALMSLGIRRELIGDILFADGYCYFFAESSIADYIIGNFSGVANNSVVPEIFDGEIHYKKVYEELTCTVTSMRLDCMTAAVTARSRSDAENMVLTGTVRLNGIENRKKDAQLKCGDILTVRRFGKYRIDSVTGTTKKGRIRIRILKYS